MTESDEPPESRGAPVGGHELSGAYVLDALGAAERAVFETHLVGCALCRRDVREFRETLAGMKRLIAQPPPPSLRSSVLRRIRGLPQQPADGDDG